MKGVAKPISDTQREFNRLCCLGGGARGGPARTKVLELLRASGQRLNKVAYHEMTDHLLAYPKANPWHICFSVGLCWGHLAKLDVAFTGAVINLMNEWNDKDLRLARSFMMERGGDPIEQSLVGAYTLFQKVTLPAVLPSTLIGLGRAQERWISPIASPSRPRYIGSWNATAMFMSALFAQPDLAKTQVEAPPILPPGGPIVEGLRLLHQGGVVARAPADSVLDDEAFEPGALYENNALLAEVRRGREDWSLIDVHSGVYMLGTHHPQSDQWV